MGRVPMQVFAAHGKVGETKYKILLIMRITYKLIRYLYILPITDKVLRTHLFYLTFKLTISISSRASDFHFKIP